MNNIMHYCKHGIHYRSCKKCNVMNKKTKYMELTKIEKEELLEFIAFHLGDSGEDCSFDYDLEIMSHLISKLKE